MCLYWFSKAATQIYFWTRKFSYRAQPNVVFLVFLHSLLAWNKRKLCTQQCWRWRREDIYNPYTTLLTLYCIYAISSHSACHPLPVPHPARNVPSSLSVRWWSWALQKNSYMRSTLSTSFSPLSVTPVSAIQIHRLSASQPALAPSLPPVSHILTLHRPPQSNTICFADSSLPHLPHWMYMITYLFLWILLCLQSTAWCNEFFGQKVTWHPHCNNNWALPRDRPQLNQYWLNCYNIYMRS